MQKNTLVSLWFCAVFAFLLPQAALAETPDDAVLLEEVPSPPTIIEGEALDEPEITIRKKGKDKVEEYRLNGELYMMKITPEHGVPYYLHKEDSQSDWVNVGPNAPISVPKWILFRF